MSVEAPERSESAPPPRPAPARGRRARRDDHAREFDRPRFLTAFAGLFYLFLFLPSAIVVLFSFNAERSLQVFGGFSLRWYDTFLSSESYRSSLQASIEIAFVTMVAGTVLGTTLAFGLVRSRSRSSGAFNVLMLIPLVTPEIVAGVSALLLFTQLGLAGDPRAAP